MNEQYLEALNSIYARFHTAWETGSSALCGYVPRVRWPNQEERGKPPLDQVWARVSQQTVFEEQTVLEGGEGRRFTTTGLFFVQLFGPRKDSAADLQLRRLAVLARDAFRGGATPTGPKVWFRNARINELPPEEDWYRLNVVTEYEYDEVG